MTNNTSMLERMARATYAKWIEDVQDLESSWSDLPESHRARLIEATRAALQAIREPSENVREVGIAARRADPHNVNPHHVWAPMIDAILSEEPTNG